MEAIRALFWLITFVKLCNEISCSAKDLIIYIKTKHVQHYNLMFVMLDAQESQSSLGSPLC